MGRLRVEALNVAYAPDRGAPGPFEAWSPADTLRLFDCEPAHFTTYMGSQARASYQRGLLRMLGPSTEPEIFAWNGPDGWRSSWPHRAGGLAVFAYDWQGRLYGLDCGRTIRGEPLVARRDPGDGSLRLSDSTFAEFIFDELVHFGDELLQTGLFERWVQSGGRTLAGTEVVGYVVPLFDGGTDSFTNMAVEPLEAYLERLGHAHFARGQRKAPSRRGLRRILHR